MSGRELYKIMIKNDLDFVIDKIIEKNNDLTIKELKIEKLEKEIDRLNNIINELENTITNFIENHTESYIDWKYDREIYLAESNVLQKLFDTYLDKLKELKDSD